MKQHETKASEKWHISSEFIVNITTWRVHDSPLCIFFTLFGTTSTRSWSSSKICQIKNHTHGFVWGESKSFKTGLLHLQQKTQLWQVLSSDLCEETRLIRLCLIFFFFAFPKRNFGLDSSQSRWLWIGAKNSTNREFSGENNCDESWDLDEEYVEKQFGYFQRYHLFVLQLFDTPFYMTNVTNPLICFNGSLLLLTL